MELKREIILKLVLPKRRNSIFSLHTGEGTILVVENGKPFLDTKISVDDLSSYSLEGSNLTRTYDPDYLARRTLCLAQLSSCNDTTLASHFSKGIAAMAKPHKCKPALEQWPVNSEWGLPLHRQVWRLQSKRMFDVHHLQQLAAVFGGTVLTRDWPTSDQVYILASGSPFDFCDTIINTGNVGVRPETLVHWLATVSKSSALQAIGVSSDSLAVWLKDTPSKSDVLARKTKRTLRSDESSEADILKMFKAKHLHFWWD
jgi:hypothetical protein